LLNIKNKLSLSFSKLDHIVFNNTRNAPTTSAHRSQIDCIATINDGHIAYQCTPILSPQMQLLSKSTSKYFKVFDNRIRFGLIIKSILFIFHCMFGIIVNIADTCSNTSLNQMLTLLSNEKKLHKCF